MARYTYLNRGSGSSEDPQTQNFSNITELTVYHSFSYRPSVWIVDGNNREINAEIVYGTGYITIYSAIAISGVVYIR